MAAHRELASNKNTKPTTQLIAIVLAFQPDHHLDDLKTSKEDKKGSSSDEHILAEELEGLSQMHLDLDRRKGP